MNKSKVRVISKPNKLRLKAQIRTQKTKKDSKDHTHTTDNENIWLKLEIKPVK